MAGQEPPVFLSWLKASTFGLMLLPAVRSAYLVGIGDYGADFHVVVEGLT
jgi:hypothetical protein